MNRENYTLQFHYTAGEREITITTNVNISSAIVSRVIFVPIHFDGEGVEIRKISSTEL